MKRLAMQDFHVVVGRTVGIQLFLRVRVGQKSSAVCHFAVLNIYLHGNVGDRCDGKLVEVLHKMEHFARQLIARSAAEDACAQEGVVLAEEWLGVEKAGRRCRLVRWPHVHNTQLEALEA